VTPRALACGVLASAWLAFATAPGIARAGDPARDGLRRLQTLEQRNRLEDLSRDVRRPQQEDRVRALGDPAARHRTHDRWRHEDRTRDVLRAREREAIGRRVDAEERLDRASERLPGAVPTDPADATRSRAAFDQELRDAEQRERLERMRRDAPLPPGPGVRRWPR
jgi:hypothetical protein